jgi:hypothetical protein
VIRANHARCLMVSCRNRAEYHFRRHDGKLRNTGDGEGIRDGKGTFSGLRGSVEYYIKPSIFSYVIALLVTGHLDYIQLSFLCFLFLLYINTTLMSRAQLHIPIYAFRTLLRRLPSTYTTQMNTLAYARRHAVTCVVTRTSNASRLAL